MKALFLAIVFLAAALIVPIFALYQVVSSGFSNIIQQIPNFAGHETAVVQYLNEQTSQQFIVLVVVIVAEALLIVGFAVSFWYALRCTKRDQCLNFPTP